MSRAWYLGITRGPLHHPLERRPHDPFLPLLRLSSPPLSSSAPPIIFFDSLTLFLSPALFFCLSIYLSFISFIFWSASLSFLQHTRHSAFCFSMEIRRPRGSTYPQFHHSSFRFWEIDFSQRPRFHPQIDPLISLLPENRDSNDSSRYVGSGSIQPNTRKFCSTSSVPTVQDTVQLSSIANRS